MEAVIIENIDGTPVDAMELLGSYDNYMTFLEKGFCHIALPGEIARIESEIRPNNDSTEYPRIIKRTYVISRDLKIYETKELLLNDPYILICFGKQRPAYTVGHSVQFLVIGTNTDSTICVYGRVEDWSEKKKSEGSLEHWQDNNKHVNYVSVGRARENARKRVKSPNSDHDLI